MADLAIRIEKLSKLYRIGQRERYQRVHVPTFERFNVDKALQ
jgi:hypothetical protein